MQPGRRGRQSLAAADRAEWDAAHATVAVGSKVDRDGAGMIAEQRQRRRVDRLDAAVGGLAQVSDHRQDDPAGAQGYFRKSLDVRRRYGDRRGVAQCLGGLGWAAAGLGQAGRAAQLLGAAEVISEELGEPLYMADLAAEAGTAQSQIQAALAPGELEAAWQAGRGLGTEAAVALALADADAPTPML